MQLLKKKKEFEKVFKKGKRIKTPLVSILYIFKDAGNPQFAFVAPKRLGSAVYRNRCKRLLREAARNLVFQKGPLDVIFFATYQTILASPESIKKDIIKAFNKKNVEIRDE